MSLRLGLDLEAEGFYDEVYRQVQQSIRVLGRLDPKRSDRAFSMWSPLEEQSPRSQELRAQYSQLASALFEAILKTKLPKAEHLARFIQLQAKWEQYDVAAKAFTEGKKEGYTNKLVQTVFDRCIPREIE